MTASLTGTEGELVLIRICVEARLLEDLLEALAEAPFPLNPQIFHHPQTVVEFPAYSSRVEEIVRGITSHGFEEGHMKVLNLLESIERAG
jgi:hypothetical protein